MTNKEVIAIVKEMNVLVDALAGFTTEDEKYYEITSSIGMLMDVITIDCPRWKYYNAWTLNRSKTSGKYWITFRK